MLLDDADLEFVGATRPLLESVVCDRVRALSGVRLLEDQDACGLLTTPDRSRVTGVRLGLGREHRGALAGDLVVDATGAAHVPRTGWLTSATHRPRRSGSGRDPLHHPPVPSGARRSGQNLVVTIPHDGRRGGVVLAVEGDRWIVTLVGLMGERPPADLDGFVEYARTLWVDDLHEPVAAAEPLGEASTGGFPSYLRRRYDRLRASPVGTS